MTFFRRSTSPHSLKRTRPGRLRASAVSLSLSLILGLSFAFPLPAAASPTPASASSAASPSARAVRQLYDYPDGAMAVTLYLDGTPVLPGACAYFSGEVYVAAERYLSLFGGFDVTYRASDESLTAVRDGYILSLRVGDPYVTVNGRVLYTGHEIKSLRGWIFAPLDVLTRALGGEAVIRVGWYDAWVTSGDPAAVANASQVYDATDLYWLSRIISAESRGEPFEGQIAVGNVVLNRVRSAEFPNTVKGVIFDSKYGIQFSPVANGRIYDAPTESAILAAKICLEGVSLLPNALYFYNPAIAASSWIGRARPYLTTIGNHAFYS